VYFTKQRHDVVEVIGSADFFAAGLQTQQPLAERRKRNRKGQRIKDGADEQSDRHRNIAGVEHERGAAADDEDVQDEVNDQRNVGFPQDSFEKINEIHNNRSLKVVLFSADVHSIASGYPSEISKTIENTAMDR